MSEGRLSRKLILHSPIANEAQLEPFVEQCLKDNVSLLAIYGPGAKGLEDAIDWILVGDGSSYDRFLCTTSHEDESFEEVLTFAKGWESESNDPVQVVRL